MKKLITCVLIILLVLALAACSEISSPGTQTPSGSAAVLEGKIVQVLDGSILLAGSGSSELYTVPTNIDILGTDNKPFKVSALKPGQFIEVGYSGSILESYPAQPHQPSYIRITGQGDDLVGFYQTVLNDLWNVDDGLNPKDGVLAFDLSQAANLTESEKNALVYLESAFRGLDGVAGTFEELSAQGYIDKQNLLFENGMLFELKLTGEAENGFTFDASKWRSGTGAYFFLNCKAVKNGGVWSYTVGSEAIS